MRRTSLTLALLLTACGQQQDAAPTPDPDAPASTPAPPAPGAGEGMTSDRDMATGQIPRRFHGVWDTESGTCDPASNTRITVTANRIEHYESVGEVTRVSAAGDDVILELAMKGEGMAWTDQTRLQLTTIAGREALLVLPALDSDIMLRPVPRLRCSV